MYLHYWQALDKDHSVVQFYLCVAKGDSIKNVTAFGIELTFTRNLKLILNTKIVFLLSYFYIQVQNLY